MACPAPYGRPATTTLDPATFRAPPARRVGELDVAAARADVERFPDGPSTVTVWSRELFRAVAERISIQT